MEGFLYTASSLHFFTVTPGLDFYILHHYVYWSHKIIVIYQIKINKSKTNQPEVPVTLDNLMLRIREAKLPDGQEKPRARQGKPGKLQS